MIEVIYIINDTGVRIKKEFYSEYLARQLANKIEHSKKCTLISYMVYPY